jgi:Flp pilus assembly protein TadB
MSGDVWQTLLGIVALVLNGIGLGFLAIQVTLARHEAQHTQSAQVEELDRRKRQATLEFVARTLDFRRSLQAKLPDDFDRPGCEALATSALAGDEVALRKLTAYLGFMETVAMGISSGIYDLETTDSAFGSRVIAVNANYSTFITARRKLGKNGSAFRELEWLAKELEQFRREPGRYTSKGTYIPLALRTNRSDNVQRQVAISCHF